MTSRARLEVSEPQVVRHVYKVQYARPPSTHTRGSRRGGDAGGMERKVSMKAYDRSTDNDIFALGSAFKSGNFDIDEFLKSFKSSGGVVTTEGNDGGSEGKEDMSTSPGENALAEWTSSSSSSPKSMINTMVGPTVVTRRKRIITTIADKDGKQVVSQTTQVFLPDEEVISEASQLAPHQNADTSAPLRTAEISEPSPSDVVIGPAIHLNNNERGREELAAIIEEEPKFDIGEKSESDEYHEATDEDAQPDATTDDNNTVIINVTGQLLTESTDEDEEIEANSVSTCPYFGRVLHKKKKKVRKISVPSWATHGSDTKGGGGKIGMTTTTDLVLSMQGAEEQLLAIQKLILNYNRMLDTNPHQFLEALFRAVKLNGLEVVKILVQLVTRKHIKLSSDAMREPESSATVLHVALLYNHEHIVDYLVSLQDRELILAVYNNAEYRHQTALHVAVANGNHRLVELLLSALSHRRDRKLLMNTVADGEYFRRKHVDGQLCLTAAAWAASSHMLAILARHGAHFGLRNTNGDTLLHRLVHASAQLPEKMDYKLMLHATFEAVGECAGRRKYSTVIADQKALEQSQKQLSTFQKLLSISNHNGLSPLALSARLGSVMLAYFMNLEKIYKIPQTKLGSISWVTYDVTDVTSFAHDTYNKFSVLHILAHHSGRLSKSFDLDDNPNHSFLDIEPIRSLIEMKWDVYRWIYIAWCVLHSAYIILFTYFTYNANSCDHEHELVVSDAAHSPPASSFVHHQPIYYSFGAFLLLPLLYLLLEFLDLFGHCPYSICQMYNMSLADKILERVRSEWVITGNGPYRFVAVGFSAFSIAWFVLYVLQDENQDIVLSLALLLGWIFVLFFTRGCRVTSKFSIMIQKMFFRDLMYFLAVYMVILLAFSFSVNVMYSKFHMGHGMLHAVSVRENLSMLQIIFYKMMNIITDLDEKEALAEARHPLFAKIMLIFYAIVAVILLMNMLIAMMNTSYETVRLTRCNLWKQQQLSIMLMIERRCCLWCPALARHSERHVWQREWDDRLRSYLDVTTGQ